jgi:hypothetical protein
MNKMNLPPPFEENAIPGRFSVGQDTAWQGSGSGDMRRKRKRRRTEEPTDVQIVEEDEEDDDDGQDAVSSKDTQTIQAHPLPPSPPHVRQPSEPRGERNGSLDDSRTNTLGHGIDASRPMFIGKPLVRLSSAKKSAAPSAAFGLGSDDESYQEVHRLTRPGVISEKEVGRQRLSPDGTLLRCLGIC